MFVDEKKHGETIIDPLSKEAFLAWIERQDPTERYVYNEGSNCALAQWLKPYGGRYLMSQGQRGDQFRYEVDGRVHDYLELRNALHLPPHRYGELAVRIRTVPPTKITDPVDCY